MIVVPAVTVVVRAVLFYNMESDVHVALFLTPDLWVSVHRW